MIKKPLISIIVPIYNVEPYLQKCVDSVLNQTFQNYELILVDDGSTDNSSKICDEYANKYDYITVIHQNNAGVSAARNTGLDSSKGEYIFFLDSDDWIERNALEKLISLIKKNNLDLAIIEIKETDNENIVFEKSDEIIFYSGDEILKFFFNEERLSIVVWNKLYKKELFNKLRFPVGLRHEDEWVSSDIFCKAQKIAFTKQACVFYRQHIGSYMHSPFSLERLDYLSALEHRCHILLDSRKYNFYTKCVFYTLKIFMNYCIKINDLDLNQDEKRKLIKAYRLKTNKIFKLLPIYKWKLYLIKRYLIFRFSMKLYKKLIYRKQ